MRIFALIIILFIYLRSFLSMEIAQAQNATIPVNVGVVLDMDTLVGKMGLTCISMALSDFYASHSYYRTRLVLNTRDSKRDVVGAAAAALDLLKNVEVRAILGPSTSTQANFIIGLGDKAHVPIMSFSTRSPAIPLTQTPYFIRSVQNDSSQVKAVSSVVHAFGWRQVVPIYVDNELGAGIIPYLTQALQGVNTNVPYWSSISPSYTDDQIVAELEKLMGMETKVFIVHMPRSLGSRFFTKAKEVGMMSAGYAWIITDSITNSLSSMEPWVIDSMQGVLGVKPNVPRTPALQNFVVRYRRKFQQEYPTVNETEVNMFGLWAYDAATALAMAVEEIGARGLGVFQKTNVSENLTDLATLEVSDMGKNLLEALLNTSFSGLSGNFHIVDGQIQSPAYQIVNVIGNGWRTVGVWTVENGIIKELNDTNTYSMSKDGAIMWPGIIFSPPKGWMIPANGRSLKIGVPALDSFGAFVKMNHASNMTGFSIDVFETVIKKLPYEISYTYIPFVGTYDDLIYQVFLGKFDAVVGDTTITANRSLYVDFTLPYTATGISMIVPLKEEKRKDRWVFLKPLTFDLWVTSLCSFAFIGFVIWVLEHRVNEDFRGPTSHQVGTIFWFSFSTMVYAQRERVLTNLARFVLIVWLFVVLVLTQSYTASLTTMLTVQQLRPTVTDVKKLIEKGEKIGYQHHSIVFEPLKRMGFEEHNIMEYRTPEECDVLLSHGSGRGGIAAAFDEIPYNQLIVAKYCSKYSTIEPTYRTNGFSFVFPKGSRLTRDVSNAILEVNDNGVLVNLEEKWFRKNGSCLDSDNSDSTYSLGLESFRGLFLVAGIVSLSSLFVFIAMFLYDHRHILRSSDPEASVWTKIMEMAKHFDQKDLTFHTIRKRENHGSVGNNVTVTAQEFASIISLDQTPNINSPQRQSNSSNHSDFGQHILEDAFRQTNGEDVQPAIELSSRFPATSESSGNSDHA